MEIWLDALQPGAQAQVTAFACDKHLRQRLADFGLVEGTKVQCRYRSPDATVTALFLRGTTLAVRRADLGKIRARMA